MSVRKSFEDAWKANFPDTPAPTNLSFLDDDGVSSLAAALDGAESVMKKLEQELARQQFIYDFVLQQLNVSISARSDCASRRTMSRRGIVVDEWRKTPVSKTTSAPRQGRTSQLAAVMAKIGFGKTNRPAVDPEDAGSSDDSSTGKKTTPLSRFYDKSNMYRASSEPSLLDCDRKFKPQPAIPAASSSRTPPGFKPVFTKDEEMPPRFSASPASGSSATMRKSTGSCLDYGRHQHIQESVDSDSMYLETDLDSIIPVTTPPLFTPTADRFELDVCNDGGPQSHMREDPVESQHQVTSKDIATESDEDDDTSSDEEPIYFNMLLFKQHNLSRANALYTNDATAITSPDSSESEKVASVRRLRRMAHHYEYIDPLLTKPLTILPADSDSDDVMSFKSEEGLADSQLDSVAAENTTVDDTAVKNTAAKNIAAKDTAIDTDVKGTAAESIAADDVTEPMSSVVLRHNRHSMAMAFDSDYSQDSDCFEMTVNMSEEDEKRRTRQEIIRSYLDGERSYMALLNSLVQFIEKLRSPVQTAQHALSSEDANTIFFKITNLHLIHKEFVCDLESALSDQLVTDDIVIGPAFHKLVYQESEISLQYVNNYQKAVTAIRRCRQNSPAFVEFTSSTSKEFEDCPSLEEILQEPIERFDSTRLILQDLLKFTPTSDSDYDSLQRTLSIAQKYLNADEGGSEGVQRMTTRYLVDNGLVVEQVGTSRKMRHVFLFNDVFICARQKVSGRERITFEHKWHIPVCDLELDEKSTKEDEKQLLEFRQQEVDSLQHKVMSLRVELKTEMTHARQLNEAHRQSDYKAQTKAAEKIRKKLMQQKAALILASPCLPMRLLHNRANKSFLLLIASDFERANWRSHIDGLRKNLCSTGESLSSCDVQDLLNNIKLPARQSTMEALLGTDDFSLEEEYLFGSLCITIAGLHGLKRSADVYCCVEVDSFGHFFTKARTVVANNSLEPVWDADFEIDLEGAQTLRILCYKTENESATLIGKGAFELSKERLHGDLKPEDIILDTGCVVKTLMMYRSRQQTLKRTLSSAKQGLFGARIRNVTRREGSRIPLIITTCVKEVEDRGMKDLGLYRVSGVLNEIQKLKKAFEKNSRAAVPLVRNTDVHVITGLFKVYLRELPEALFTDTLYPKLVEAFALEEPEAKEKYMRRLMLQLPEPNYSTAMFILDHLIKVSEQETGNKMSLQNLATVFGPTLLRPAEKQTGKLSMEELLSAGTRDAMNQIGILRYLLNLKLRGTFGVRL